MEVFKLHLWIEWFPVMVKVHYGLLINEKDSPGRYCLRTTKKSNCYKCSKSSQF